MKRTVTIPLYEEKVVMVDDKAQYLRVLNAARRKARKKERRASELEGDYGWTDGDGDTLFVGIFDNPNIGILAHEAVHVATLTLDERGVTIDADNDEATAYVVQWFVMTWASKMGWRVTRRASR